MPDRTSTHQSFRPSGGRGSARRTLPLGKRLLFAAVTLFLFFVVLELSLGLIGIEPAYRNGDPLVGFSRQLPHFVEKQDAEGTAIMVTAPGKEALNPQRFPKTKPADTMRIACLGGSTTYGRPFWDETSFSGWLRAYLPAADPGRRWEVINGGGISYASYRVLAVMEELAEHQPDLFVISLGHNEFLERRTYGTLLEQAELLKDLRASAHRLRTATLVRQIADGFSRREEKKSIVLGEMVKRQPIDALGPEAYRRDDAHKAQVVTHFRLSLNRILDVADRCGAKVILVAPASNFRHAMPFKSAHRAGLEAPSLDEWRASSQEAMRALDEGDHALALARLEKCLAIDPRHAATHYHHGRTLMALARHDEAREAFAQAIEEDICPLRAIRPIVSVIRETAAARDVPLVDFQALLDAQTEHGITGDDFFHDHLHPSIDANRLLALAILERMTERAWLTPHWTPSDRTMVATQVRKGLDAPRYAEELCKLSYVMDTLGQEHMAVAAVREAIALAPDSGKVVDYAIPFYAQKMMFSPAAALLEERARRSPDDRRALGALGDAYSSMNRFADAAEAYARLLALEPNNVAFLQQLGVALSRAGDHARAAEHLSEAVRLNPRSAELHHQLGLALAAGGQHELAIEEFTRVLDLHPGHQDAIEELRKLR